MRHLIRITALLGLMFVSPPAFAGQLVEKDGPFEINWSSGKVRFYGVGKLHEGEDSMRGAEQRAWADALQRAEKYLAKLMAPRLGLAPVNASNQLAKLAPVTTSVSTTYFGDKRIKVVLETPLLSILPQLLGDTSVTVPSGDPVGFIVKISGDTKPTAALKVIDEGGREISKIPSPKWFKGETSAAQMGLSADSPVVQGTMVKPGVLKVEAADWRSGYEAAVANGKAAIILR